MQVNFKYLLKTCVTLQKLCLLANGECLGWREGPGKGSYTWITYAQTLEQIRYIGSGLMNKGIESGNLTNIGIYSANRKEVV